VCALSVGLIRGLRRCKSLGYSPTIAAQPRYAMHSVSQPQEQMKRQPGGSSIPRPPSQRSSKDYGCGVGGGGGAAAGIHTHCHGWLTPSP
jgi:hypothetical protein